MERLTIGAGFAATVAHATAASDEIGSTLALSQDTDPWRTRGEWRLGQPASELVSEGLAIQPEQCEPDPGRFASAAALADAIAITAERSRFAVLLDTDVAEPLQVSPSGVDVRSSRGTIHAQWVDVAVGLGPPRCLPRQVLDPDQPIPADVVVYGQDQLDHPTLGPVVVVVGGGATAAWNARTAAQRLQQTTDAAHAVVLWIGTDPARDDRRRAKPQQRRLDTVERKINNASAARKHSWLLLRAKLQGFFGARQRRNRDTFRWRRSESRVPICWSEGKLVRARYNESREQLHLQFELGLPSGTATYELWCDQLVVSIGQSRDPRHPGTAAALVRRLPLTWLQHDGNEPSPFKGVVAPGRAVALQDARQGTVRVLGAAAWIAYTSNLEGGSSARETLRQKLEHQASLAPPYSREIPGALFQSGADIPLANGRDIDRALGKQRADWIRETQS